MSSPILVLSFPPSLDRQTHTQIPRGREYRNIHLPGQSSALGKGKEKIQIK
jgi:hypothetical protein